VLASRGSRETEDGGTTPVEDSALASALRRKARSVYWKTAFFTALAAALVANSMFHFFRL